MPLEPWQRLSQAVFEKWLKGVCDRNALIDLRFGCKLEEVHEIEGGVRVSALDTASGVRRQLVSKYLVGCDGGSSRVRRSLGIPLDGGPM
jgi:FAD-dependent monooxygenase